MSVTAAIAASGSSGSLSEQVHHPKRHRLPTDFVTSRKRGDLLLVFDVERQFPIVAQQEVARHQESGRECVRLDFLDILCLGRRARPKVDPEMLVDADLDAVMKEECGPKSAINVRWRCSGL
jgi:hypothetical protein